MIIDETYVNWICVETQESQRIRVNAKKRLVSVGFVVFLLLLLASVRSSIWLAISKGNFSILNK